MSSSAYCYVANNQLLYLCKKSRFDRFLAGLVLCAAARWGEPGMIGCVKGQLNCEQTDKNEWLLEPMTAFSHPAVTVREIGTWPVWVGPLALAIRTGPPISVQSTSASGVRVWCSSTCTDGAVSSEALRTARRSVPLRRPGGTSCSSSRTQQC